MDDSVPVREIMTSRARDWRDLARDVSAAIEQLAASNRAAMVPVVGQAILLSVASDHRTIRLAWCRNDGTALDHETAALDLLVGPLPVHTDATRDPGPPAPNASIDRAICKADAGLVTHSRDPESFELLTHRRFRLFVTWDGKHLQEAFPWAYGLWDE